jgi:hypothetical protein
VGSKPLSNAGSRSILPTVGRKCEKTACWGFCLGRAFDSTMKGSGDSLGVDGCTAVEVGASQMLKSPNPFVTCSTGLGVPMESEISSVG